MQGSQAVPLRVGYVVKRFPRLSETFIAQEILELERRGIEVCIFALREIDTPAPHAWLQELRAEVVLCEPEPMRTAWEWLHAQLMEREPSARRGLLSALCWAAQSEKGRRDLGHAVAVVHAAAARGVQRLHAHFATRPASVALLAHAAGGLPFSFTAHAKDIFATGPPLPTWRRFARRADFIATVSESNRQVLVERLGPRWAHKVRRLYNGVDLAAIRPPDRRRREGPPHFVCVARLVPKKGVADLLEAAALLRDRGVDFSCEIVGDGPEADALHRIREERDLGGHVRFVGPLPHEQVITRLCDSDAFVLPSRIELDGDRDVLPTVLLEAMAAGLPCISTSVGGIPEIVAEAKTGLLVAQRDPVALCDALETLAADPGRRARMGAAGRQRAEQHFDRRRNVAVLHRWFSCDESAVPPGVSTGVESVRRVAG